MAKVYQDKDVDIESFVMDCAFFGDERDLIELLGNVLDNACKYGKGKVKLALNAPERGGDLIIVIEDDGPGIAIADRKAVLQRGERLDTRESGQGIGLAVVNEIVNRYGGKITLDESILGGARVTIRLP